MNEIEQLYNWWFISLVMFVGYFLIVGILYVLIYNKKKSQMMKYKIQKTFSPLSKIRKEIAYSTSTLIIYCTSSWAVYYFYELGLTKMYFKIDDFGIVYFFISIFIMIGIHDTYFYWSHRLIHIPKLFNTIHKVHHLSNNPTPWASFSFHPIEAIISIGYIPIIVFLLPCHPLALFVFLSIMLIISVVGHLGYEFFSNKFMNNYIGKWINPSTFHNFHHKKSNYNFGLYFTFWDRIMGTFKG